jgi:hypothetical protein
MLLALIFPFFTLAVEPLPVAPLSVPASQSPPVLASSDCEQAQKQLALFAAGLRATCARDGDCAAKIVAADPCAAMVIVNKDAIGLASRELWARQENATKSCNAEWSKRPACKKPLVRAVCRDSKCVDGGLLPGAVK